MNDSSYAGSQIQRLLLIKQKATYKTYIYCVYIFCNIYYIYVINTKRKGIFSQKVKSQNQTPLQKMSNKRQKAKSIESRNKKKPTSQ